MCVGNCSWDLRALGCLERGVSQVCLGGVCVCVERDDLETRHLR